MPPHTPTSQRPPAAPLLIWWIFWLGLTAGLVAQRVFLKLDTGTPAAALGYIALAPLAVSAVIRFLVLPRMKIRAKAFPIFVVGMATAEACGLLGLVLGGEHRDTFVGIGLGMLLIYAPFFARNYDDGGGHSHSFRES